MKIHKIAIVFILFIFHFSFLHAQRPRWAKNYGVDNEDYSTRCIVDAQGNLIVSGSFTDSLRLGIGFFSAATSNIYLAKFDFNGNLIWVQAYGGAQDDFVNDLAWSADGNILIGGNFNGTSQIGTVNLTSTGDFDILYAKIDAANGNVIWAKSAGGSGHDEGSGICSSNNGNIFMTGHFNNTLQWGSYSQYSYGGNDIFICGMDNSGNSTWLKKGGASNEDNGKDITSDNAGNVFVTGDYVGVPVIFPPTQPNITFDGQQLFGIATQDMFVAKYNNSGNLQWVKGLSGNLEQRGVAVTCDNSGAVYAGGYTIGDVYDGGTNISTNQVVGGEDFLISKYNSSGNREWTKVDGGFNNDRINSLFYGEDSKVYFTGFYQGAPNIQGINIPPTIVATPGGPIKSLIIGSYTSSGVFDTLRTFRSFEETIGNGLTTYGTQSLFMIGAESFNIDIDNIPVNHYTLIPNNIKDPLLIRFDFIPPPGELCEVTVDTNSVYNNIYWDNNQYTNIDSVFIYREGASSTYNLIGKVSIDSLSLYVDTNITGPFNGDPNASAHRYKIALLDTAGNLGPMGNYHSTIFMQDMQSGSLMWTQYLIEGQISPIPNLNNYTILKDSVGTQLTVISTLPASTTNWTDPNYWQYSGSSDYRVEVVWNYTCDPTRALINTTRSNIKKSLPDPVSIKQNFKTPFVIVIPNPASDYIKILASMEITNITFSDLTGCKFNVEANNENEISIKDIPSGIYFIECEFKNAQVQRTKLIINH